MASQARASQWVVALNPDGTSIAPAQQVVVPVNRTGAMSNNGPTTSPGALAGIAQILAAAVSTDTYDVWVTTNVGGTTAVADIDNLTLTAAGITARLANGINGNSSPFGPFRFQFGAGATNITVSTVGAGTAGSVYSATISAIRVV
jgi:hypothetical protein